MWQDSLGFPWEGLRHDRCLRRAAPPPRARPRRLSGRRVVRPRRRGGVGCEHRPGRHLVIDSITGQDLTELGDLPPGAAPLTFVEVDQTFTVDVSFEDGSGAEVPFNSDTVLEITGTSNNGTVVLAPSRVTVPKGNATFSLPTSIGVSANQVVLTVKPVAKQLAKTVAPGVSYVPTAAPVKDLRFDVAQDARISDGVSGFEQGIGGGADCAQRHRAGARVRGRDPAPRCRRQGAALGRRL